jgi:hypothetical protein
MDKNLMDNGTEDGRQHTRRGTTDPIFPDLLSAQSGCLFSPIEGEISRRERIPASYCHITMRQRGRLATSSCELETVKFHECNSTYFMSESNDAISNSVTYRLVFRRKQKYFILP